MAQYRVYWRAVVLAVLKFRVYVRRVLRSLTVSSSFGKSLYCNQAKVVGTEIRDRQARIKDSWKKTRYISHCLLKLQFKIEGLRDKQLGEMLPEGWSWIPGLPVSVDIAWVTSLPEGSFWGRTFKWTPSRGWGILMYVIESCVRMNKRYGWRVGKDTPSLRLEKALHVFYKYISILCNDWWFCYWLLQVRIYCKGNSIVDKPGINKKLQFLAESVTLKMFIISINS
jgi:hypothetical protein